jgi:hypothetical protein
MVLIGGLLEHLASIGEGCFQLVNFVLQDLSQFELFIDSCRFMDVSVLFRLKCGMRQTYARDFRFPFQKFLPVVIEHRQEIVFYHRGCYFRSYVQVL